MTVEEAVELTIRRMEDCAHPDRMTLEEALEYYESLDSWLDGAIAGLREDIENAE